LKQRLFIKKHAAEGIQEDLMLGRLLKIVED
jgi:hypothetical protein